MTRMPRVELLLCFACAAASAMLAASQFTDMFQLTPPGGEALEAVTSQDQHGYAMLVLAVLSLILLVFAMSTDPPGEQGGRGLREVAAFGVAATGVVALLIFLTVDLPDVNKIGPLNDPNSSFIDAKAQPQVGFWLELVGSVVLAASGVALATMRSEGKQSAGGAAPAEDGRGTTSAAGSKPPTAKTGEPT